MSGDSPILLRRRVALRLRRLREQAGVTLDDAAAALDCSKSTLSRLETARQPLPTRSVRDLCNFYGADARVSDELVDLAGAARRPNWWEQEYRGVLSSSAGFFVSLEAAAAEACSYHAALVPGLLQTKAYASGLATKWSLDQKLLANLVGLRMARQAALTRLAPLRLRVVLDETVLRRSPAGPEVMRDQLSHLAKVSQLPNVTVQMLPFTAGLPAAGGYESFDILEFAEPDLPIVFIELSRDSILYELPDQVAHYRGTFEQLASAALSERDSRAMITQAATHFA